MKRLFIGVKFQPTRRTIDFYSKLKSKLKEDKIKWSPIENMHITLKFLGETDSAIMSSIIENLEQIATKFNPFSIDILGLGRFKKQRNTKIIWLGIGNANILNALANEIDRAMKDLGFESENRPFKAHLTLGRVKYLSDEEQLLRLIKESENEYFQSVLINKVFLIESILQQNGSKYKVVQEIAF